MPDYVEAIEQVRRQTMNFKLRSFGDPVLNTPAVDVAKGEDVTALVSAMKGILGREKGLGLAAQQVGSTKRVALLMLTPCRYCQGQQIHQCCLSTTPDYTKRAERYLVVAINLRVTAWSEKEQVSEDEGCLSVRSATGSPYRCNVIRRVWVDACWTDESGAAHYRTQITGLDAIIVQHEAAHLDGHCIADGSTREERKQYYRDHMENS